ncbi:hypothetical protein SAMN06265171_103391 [Chryseobacterium rhizoplanae]|uniref:Uncharacterized protein n=1 Tax=Chryseobacterium rhizoplanae TaxID=1609531 RepID=A0A521CU66_9FLAO|nr:hypothetical protein [Chryseobacterium rhizoplanae]SMO62997.1 hypothetical protein SAMN06265171_103391 [Chryseobacterium rhizoplanae]
MIKNINIVKSKFNRIKQDFFKTDLFENLEDNIQQQINNNVLYLDNEIPVLGYYASSYDYWLLTNIRLITSDFIIFLDDIEIINIPEIFDEGRGNSECESLAIVEKDSGIYTLKLERLTWYVIFNIFNFIIKH